MRARSLWRLLLRQFDEGKVVVEVAGVPVRVFEEVGGFMSHLGELDLRWLLGSSHNFNFGSSVSAVGGGEDPFVADDGASAEPGGAAAADVESHLPGELVGSRDLSSDDLAGG